MKEILTYDATWENLKDMILSEISRSQKNKYHTIPLMRVKMWLLNPVRLFETSWIVAHQAPLSMGFSRHEYWSGLPFPPPRDLLNPGMDPEFLASPSLADEFFTTASPGKPWTPSKGS